MMGVAERVRKIARSKPKVSIRTAQFEDIPGILDVELTAWGLEGSATSEKLRSRISIYPKGQRVAVVEGADTVQKIVGFVSTMRLSAAQVHQLRNWRQVTDDGYIRSHNPKGEYLYGVDLSVHNDYERMGIGNLLLAEIAEMVIRRKIRYGLLGGRLPGLREFNEAKTKAGFPTLDAGEYMEQRRNDGKPLDKELRFYLSIWFMENLGVLPDYFHNSDSLNNGVLLRWHNPLYRWFFLYGLAYRLPLLDKWVVWLSAKMIKALI